MSSHFGLVNTDHLIAVKYNTYKSLLQACKNLTFNLFFQAHRWPPNNSMLAFSDIFLNIFVYITSLLLVKGGS